MNSNRTRPQHIRQHLHWWAVCRVAAALCLSATAGSADVIGNNLTGIPNTPGGDTGSVLILDGFHNPVTPNFTIPAGGGVLTRATLLNDTDSAPESVDLLVLRPNGANSYTVIHRVRITDDTPVTNSGTTDYPLANLPVQAGDVLAHWGLGNQPIPMDCCGNGPGDVQVLNLASANFDVGKTFTFAPYPQARSYYWNVTLGQEGKDTDNDGLDDQWELTYAPNLTDLNGTGVGPGPGAGTGDLDGDGLLDIDELKKGTDPTKPDTDGDTLSDGAEVLGAGLRPPTSPTKADTDGDGLSDAVETNDGTFNGPTDTGTDPTQSDTDGDGLTDVVETNDGSFNGLTDTGTDPNKLDTDGDGYSDGNEVTAGTDPTNPKDPAALSGEIIGNDLAGLPNQPDGDTGSVLIVDGFHNPGITPTFTIPASGGVLTMATLLNDTDSDPESVDLLVVRPNGDGTYTVIHRVTITDDAPVANSGTTDYPLANLPVQAGDVLAHWGLGHQPIPHDCCGNGPGDVQISNLASANFEVGNTFTFAPFPQARSYYWNVTLGGGEPFAFTTIALNRPADTVDVTWVSKPGKTYRLKYSSDLVTWNDEIVAYPAGGATGRRTSYQLHGIPPSGPRRFFRVMEEPKPIPGGEFALKIEYPKPHCIFQRNGQSGEIPIEGTCTGSPGEIEARFNGGAWTTISAGPNAGRFTGTLTATVGQGLLEVRVKKAPEVPASVSPVSIGDIYVTAGQSNAAGWASVLYQPLAGLPYELSLYKRGGSGVWVKLTDPTSISGNGSPWALTTSYLCQEQNVPIGLITGAISGAWLTDWLKPGGHYTETMAAVRQATHGSMKVRAVLWFQGEADCNPSPEYAGRSMNGNHDLYLQNLNRLVSDLHTDLKLGTVHVGVIGSVPHTIGGSVLSTRENIFQIRRALQSSWLNPQISPGPVVYDVALESDSIHIHFNTPDEMIPLAKRWAAAISEFTYTTGVGRGPILQTATLAPDNRTITLTFDKALKIGDFRNNIGTKVEGWCFEQGQQRLTDTNVESATVNGTVVTVRLKSAVSGAWTASYGIDDDGAGKKIARGLTDLPVEPFYRVPLPQP